MALQPSEESLAKIDGVIADIRMINLHLFNYVRGSRGDDGKKDNERENKKQKFRQLNVAHMQEHVKRVSEYLKKTFKQIGRAKLIVSPLCFRFLKPIFKDQNFLRKENENFGVKFVLTDLERESLLHLEIYRKSREGRVSGLAFRKLEISFLYELSQKYQDGMVWQEVLEMENKTILDQVTTIMSGVLCSLCGKHLAFNNDHLVFLPSTVRDVGEGKDGRLLKIYYHESCL